MAEDRERNLRSSVLDAERGVREKDTDDLEVARRQGDRGALHADAGREVADDGANEDWAVLMPNVRGSWGYGMAFAQSIDGHFGIEPADDVLTGIAALDAAGEIDADRVAIASI